MSPIKSTLDIILEKTRHLSMDREELAALEASELRKRVRGMVALYLDGRKDRNALARDMRSLPSEAAETVRSAWQAELLEHLTLTGGNERILSAVELLEGPSAARDWERVCRQEAASIQPGHEERKADARQRHRARLAAEGLSGSALTPADARNPFLQEAEEALTRRFREAVAAALGLS